jgi:hypothetical protein
LVGACAWIAAGALRRAVAAGASERPAAGEPTRRAALLLCASGLVVFVLVYLRLPYEPGYLIPIVPFTVLALGLLLGRRAFACVAALTALSSLVSVSGQGITRGRLLEDLRVRELVVSRAHAILAEGDRATQPTVVIARNWFPAIAVLLTQRGCRGRTALEEVERRQIRCGTITWLKAPEAIASLDAPAGDVLHLVPGPGRPTLGPGFPYPDRR